MSLLYERIRNGAWIEARLHFDSAYALTEGFARFETPQDQTVINAWVEVFRFVFLMADDLPPDPEWHERLAVLRQQAVGRLPVLAMALCTLSVIVPLDQGDRALALAEAEIGLQLRETVQAPRAALFVLLHKASALIASARLEDARTAIEEASALAQEDHYADSYERVSCQIHAGLLAYENGEAERAYEILALCASRVARVHGWRRMWSELFCTLARLAHATGGRASSSDWLEKGRAYALSNRQLGLKLALDLEEVGLVLRDGDLRLARLLFDALAPRLAQTPAPAPMIRHQAQILKIALLEGEGHYDDALAVLDGVDRAAVSDCDLRQHLWLEVLALGLERDRLDEDAWRWRHADVMALAARYLGLSADPVLAARLTRLTEADCAPPSSTAQLSPREQQILSLIVEGLSSKEIARRLNISEGTVKSHRKKVYEKLGVNMRSQAISRAREILGN